MQFDILAVSLVYDLGLHLLTSSAAIFMFVNSHFLVCTLDKQDTCQVAVLSASSERSTGRVCRRRLQ